MQNSVITAGRSREVPLLLRLPGQRSREVPLLLRLPGQHSSKRTISMFRRSNRRNRTMHHNRRLQSKGREKARKPAALYC